MPKRFRSLVVRRARPQALAPRLAYALAGAALAAGAPAGWLLLRVAASGGLARFSPYDELSAHAALYAYLLVATSAAFSAFGYLLGVQVELLRDAAARDPLTGLANRRSLDDALDRAVAEAARYGRPLSVAMMDVDRFKLVNDRHGHTAGDAALRAVARVLSESARQSDVVARYGGEEFLFVLPETTVEEAAVLAARVLERVRALEIPVAGGPVRLTASVGVAGGVPNGQEWRAQLLRAADGALYDAKSAGRDRVAAHGMPA